MTFLITGASGLLGSAFSAALPTAAICHRDDVPQNSAGWLRLITSTHATTVINCIAHTDVEGAEKKPEIDYQVNAILPGELSKACAAAKTTLIHFSSTGCYGDWKDTPYTEQDPVRPTTAHHTSKIAGEKLIKSSGCDFAIFRLGWLYGGAPGQAKNFVWKRLIEAAKNSVMQSDATQTGCPTFVNDIVPVVLATIDEGCRGVYNLVSEHPASRYEYVAAIIKAAGLECAVMPGPSYVRLAKVSKNEAATNHNLTTYGLNYINDWRISLPSYVRSLISSDEWQSINQGLS